MIVLETERLYLREWVPDDWIRFKPLVVDPRVLQYIHQGEPGTDERIENRVREYIEFGQSRGWHLWPVIHRADTKLIGFCGFSDGFPPDVEIGWRLLPDYWGQGLATEAATATLEYGFAMWDFPRVIAVAQKLNRASIRVMERIGMTFDGTFTHDGAEVVRYVVENPRNVSPDAASSLICRKAMLQDAPLLARMNQHLLDDEGSRNPMPIAELEARMAGWLSGDWRATVIEQDGVPVGYVLYQFRSDEYRPSETAVYVRQYFIDREHRSRGIGRRAFGIVSETHFSKASSVVLDVLETNPRARCFWEVIGFRPYCTTMKLTACSTR
jgi:ribosomal-protein-alanine N-acetyltransferase